MTADVFVDTNILLYSIDEDPASQTKRQRSQQILLTEGWAWSVQVAAEFFVNATSPKRPFRLTSVDAAAMLETWFAYPILGLTPALVRAAINVYQRFQLSYWDCRHSRRSQAAGLSHGLQRRFERGTELRRRDRH